MARFYVGQRCRIVRPTKPENLGKEVVIVSMDKWPRGAYVVKSGTYLPFDTDCTTIGDGEAISRCTAFWQLEPITDRNEIVTWESCEWRPGDLGTIQSDTAESRHTEREIVEK